MYGQKYETKLYVIVIYDIVLHLEFILHRFHA